jgi:hypothetical protein
MSTIRSFSSIDWFHRGRKTAAPGDPQPAALRRLIRMLAGDASQRTPPPVTLAGQPTNGSIVHDEPPALPDERRGSKWGRVQSTLRGHVGRSNLPEGNEPIAEDANGPYSREELERMDRKFVSRLERAFESGEESRAAAVLTRTTRFRG